MVVVFIEFFRPEFLLSLMEKKEASVFYEKKFNSILIHCSGVSYFLNTSVSTPPFLSYRLSFSQLRNPHFTHENKLLQIISDGTETPDVTFRGISVKKSCFLLLCYLVP